MIRCPNLLPPILTLTVMVAASCVAGAPANGDSGGELSSPKMDGYKGLWYGLGLEYEYGDRYSGGFANYSANHTPKAIYAPEVERTFFVYAGTTEGDERHLLIMASYYDHGRHIVPRPTVVFDKEGVDDAHDNPAIAIDGNGYIWVFVSGQGRAAEARPGHKFRSREPYSVEAFEEISEEEMTYIQPWFVPGRGLFHLFTKYTDGRELYWETSLDGRSWTADRKLAGIEGHFQVSSVFGSKVGTFFNRHPGGTVDQRTDLYYVETADFGTTWTTVQGEPLQVPLTNPNNPALVVDYASRGRLQYTSDLNWDANGHPIFLYITSAALAPGPDGDPREWTVTHWTGSEWLTAVITTSDHNMDVGSLYVDGDVWRVIGPTEVGPQPWGTGGEIAIWESRDRGASWTRTTTVTTNSRFNHSYVRRPLSAQDPFYAFWADGDPSELSESRIYFTNSTGGRLWVLPYDMTDEFAEPIEIVREAEEVR